LSEKKGFVSIVPLANFDSDVDLIRLDDNLCLRRINRSELEKLIKRASGYEDTLMTALLDVEYVIEKKMATVRKFGQWHEGSSYVRDIILALRIFKEGDVNTPTAFLLESTGKSYVVSNTSPLPRFFENPYFLKQKEINKFVELWKRLQSVEKEKPHLKFPLTQFTKAFEENFPEDVMVDFTTAFESLVFYGVKEPPRPYGKATGIAIGMLLGKNLKERTEIEKNLKKAYEVRNAVVHGHLRKRLHKYDYERGTQLILKVEDYLRRSLRTFLEE
jgi:hypothetical protein